MKRILLTLSYDGTAYHGWQFQRNGSTVQGEIEKTLCVLTGVPVSVMGASRTDAGVHALGQAAHFDTNSPIPPEKFAIAMNTHLPDDIRITASREVPDGLHARFSAVQKTYRYQWYNAAHASALERNRTHHIPFAMDVLRMQRAAVTLLGRHDFAAFMASGGTAKSTVREISDIRMEQMGSLFTLTISGRSFLYNMVRIIAGTLGYVATGKLPETVFEEALATGNRLCLGVTAPPQGLTLMEVRYPV